MSFAASGASNELNEQNLPVSNHELILQEK